MNLAEQAEKINKFCKICNGVKSVIDDNVEVKTMHNMCCNQLRNGTVNLNHTNESVNAVVDKLSSCSVNAESLKENFTNVTFLPSFTKIDLTKIKTLDLSKSNLITIPDGISLLSNLVRLNLSWNRIRAFPKSLNYLNKLRSLNVSHNCFSVTPECLIEGHFGALTYLDISYNLLKSFPIQKGSLQLLKSVDLSGNLLDSVPEWFVMNVYNTVENLDLSNNGGNVLQNLANNEILCDMKFMKNSLLKTLRTLKLSKCSVTKLNIFVLSAFLNLTILNLSNDFSMSLNQRNNVLSDISFSALPNFENITELYISNVHLYAVSDDIKYFSSLKILDVSHNELTRLPPTMCSLKELTCFIASNNFLSSLPDNFGQLESLKKLYLSSNQLTSLPQSMSDLKHLEVLDLYDNFCEFIPDFIWQLSLKEFDISYNYIDLKSISEGDDAIRIRNSYRYIMLRNEFAKNMPGVFSRYNCQRPLSDNENCYDSDENDKLTHNRILTSDDSDEDFDYYRKTKSDLAADSYANKDDGNEVKTVSTEEEDWEKDYDSDDYFNPNKVGPVKQVKTKIPILSCDFEFPFFGGNDVNRYNPSDYHPRCISCRRQKPTFGASVEGQFDDA